MRKLLSNSSGFTLVELMVVVVVLGILAGIAVQRMGDVRDRSERAAEEANLRLLLGAANLARARNYGDYMYLRGNPEGSEHPYQERNATIRWQRPCEGPAVVQWLGQHHYRANYRTGYNTFAGFWVPPGGIPSPSGYAWNTSQVWNLTDYFEAFPVGYAVEIVFAARDVYDGEVTHGDNSVPDIHGYHPDKSTWVNESLVLGNLGEPSLPYDDDHIFIYKLVNHDKVVEDAEWDPLGNHSHMMDNYPYFIDGDSYEDNWEDPVLFPSDWELIFPKDD